LNSERTAPGLPPNQNILGQEDAILGHGELHHLFIHGALSEPSALRQG